MNESILFIEQWNTDLITGWLFGEAYWVYTSP